MRGIPEDKAVEIGEQIDSCKYLECSVKEWLRDECHELQEPWMTLDDFLKSGFEGWCWINSNQINMAYKLKDDFYLTADEVDLRVYKIDQITHVMPIHKPEPVTGQQAVRVEPWRDDGTAYTLSGRVLPARNPEG